MMTVRFSCPLTTKRDSRAAATSRTETQLNITILRLTRSTRTPAGIRSANRTAAAAVPTTPALIAEPVIASTSSGNAMPDMLVPRPDRNWLLQSKLNDRLRHRFGGVVDSFTLVGRA